MEDVDLDRFPEVLAKPEAVILDTKDNNLLYVFTPINDKRKGKLVVRVNYSQKLKVGSAKRKIQATNTWCAHPWGDIPARPFLGISGNDKEMILEKINDFIAGQWQ